MNETNETQVNETPAIDPLALLKTVQEEEAAEEVAAPDPEDTMSPLERAKLAKATSTKGMEIDKETFDDGTKPKELKDHTQTPETEAGVEQSLAELDAMIKVAEQNPNLQLPEDPQAQFETMSKLAQAADKVLAGEEVPTITTPEESGAKPYGDEAPITDSEKTPDVSEGAPVGADAVPTKNNMVSVVIDKTGLGTEHIDFTDEEREKLTKATRIQLVEVEDKKLKSATFNKVGRDDSFLGRVEQYDLSTIVTPITLPASRYRCRMRGMSFGEMSDIGLDPETITYDVLNKRFSVIYNNMIDTSVGKFETYEDFLKNTSYMDFEMLVFGMVCSTLPEDDSITLTCARASCKKEYDAKYSPRSLIRWDDCDPRLLEAVSKICDVASDPEKARAYYEESSVHKVKAYEMPYSKVVIDFGAVSMWDFLNGVVSIMLDPDFNEKYKDGLQAASLAAQSMTVVRSVSVPKADGTYDTFTAAEDIFEILRSLNPQDFSVVLSVLDQYARAYHVPFYIPNSKCPHCGYISKKVNIPIRELVFTKFQMLGSTAIDLHSAVII